MAEYTKGPWVVNPFCAQVDSSAPSKLGGLLPIARLLWPTDQRNEAETEANAHLIAAAPDLLEACEALVAKADADDGIPDGPVNAGGMTRAATLKLGLALLDSLPDIRAAIAKARNHPKGSH